MSCLQRDIDLGLNSDCRAYAKEMGLVIKGTNSIIYFRLLIWLSGVLDDVVTVERKTKTHIWKIEFSVDG